MHVESDFMCLLKNHSLQDGFIRTWLHLCPTSAKLLNMMCTTFYHNNAHIEKPFSSMILVSYSFHLFYSISHHIISMSW